MCLVGTNIPVEELCRGAELLVVVLTLLMLWELFAPYMYSGGGRRGWAPLTPWYWCIRVMPFMLLKAWSAIAQTATNTVNDKRSKIHYFRF